MDKQRSTNFEVKRSKQNIFCEKITVLRRLHKSCELRRTRVTMHYKSVLYQHENTAYTGHFARLANTLKDEESARDNHVFARNFAKYSPILKNH